MRAVILQPGYLPWLGFFEQLQRADVFVIYDDVQFDKRGWRNRNRVKGPDGPVWLTVPVIQKGRFRQKVTQVSIDNDYPWRRKHLEAIRRYYSRTPYFDRYFPELEEVIQVPQENDRIMQLFSQKERSRINKKCPAVTKDSTKPFVMIRVRSKGQLDPLAYLVLLPTKSGLKLIKSAKKKYQPTKKLTDLDEILQGAGSCLGIELEID